MRRLTRHGAVSYTHLLASYADAMETYADFATVNRVIDAYNLAQTVDAEKLTSIQVLLKQPYFAKVVLQMKPGQEPKELYIGTAGIADENYRRLVVDWRSPVAEVYYNQENGPTSYEANGCLLYTSPVRRRRRCSNCRRSRPIWLSSISVCPTGTGWRSFARCAGGRRCRSSCYRRVWRMPTKWKRSMPERTITW